MSFVISHPDLDGTKVVPEHTLATYASHGWVLEEQLDSRAPEPAPVLKQPAKSGSAAEWRTYAVAVGDLTVAEAFGKTRDEIAERYNPAPTKTPGKGNDNNKES